MRSELTDELLARARQIPDRTGNACGAVLHGEQLPDSPPAVVGTVAKYKTVGRLFQKQQAGRSGWCSGR